MLMIIPLLLAHFIADYILQTRNLAMNKRHFPTLMAHGAILFLLTIILSGGHWKIAILISITHIVIDAIRSRLSSPNPLIFITDQLAHFVMIIIAACIWNTAFTTSIWSKLPHEAIQSTIIITAAISTIFNGQHLVGQIMARFAPKAPEDGLVDAGRMFRQLLRHLDPIDGSRRPRKRHWLAHRCKIHQALRHSFKKPRSRLICHHRHSSIIFMGDFNCLPRPLRPCDHWR